MLIGDPTDRAIINGLQGGFPLTERPFRDAGHELGLSEGELIDGVQHLIDTGRLSRAATSCSSTPTTSAIAR